MIHRRALALAAAALLSACATPIVAPLGDFPQAPVTPPLPRSAVQTIAVTSCSNEAAGRNQTVFDQVRAARPDLLLMLGDNVYGSWSPDDPALPDLRRSYDQQSQRPEFRALVSSVPTLSTWDDHDFGKNDGGGDFAHKALAQRMFADFWRLPARDERRNREGVYTSRILGPPGQRLQIILLDTRYFRSPLTLTDERDKPGKERYVANPDPAMTMLGPAQWAWLEGELKKSADLRIIASSIQVVAEGHGWEKWGNFPTEKQRMVDLIARTGAQHVFFLSGDRHNSSLNVLRDSTPYPLYDLTASAVNMPWMSGLSEAGPLRIEGPYGPENFGEVRIDWAARTISLGIRDIAGKPVFGRTVAFDEIRASPPPPPQAPRP